jgi:hypothetical protein
MSKFVIEPNKIYDVNDGSNVFFIRVVERWYSDYKVEIASYPDLDDFNDSDLRFEPAIYTKFELNHLFGSFVFDDPESDEEEEDEEA